MTTELGHRVGLEDWEGFHAGRILNHLMLCENAFGNRENIGISTISAITGLDEKSVKYLIVEMVKSGHLSENNELYSLSEFGYQFVKNSPKFTQCICAY
jgi:hypothetical protein